MKAKNLPHTIYAIQCTQNNKVYIGSTTSLNSRISSHFNDLRKGIKTYSVSWKNRQPSQWQIDFNEFGEDSFKVFAIEENVLGEKSKDREDYYIEYYNACDPEHGYNIRPARAAKHEVIKGMPKLIEEQHKRTG